MIDPVHSSNSAAHESTADSESTDPIFSPVRRKKLVDDVYERLLDAILGGRLAGGDSLNELALAARLHVSRTPVHEAVARLVADGLAEQLGTGRARVTQFTRGHILSIYEMRQILEGAAAELAAPSISLERVEALRRQGLALRDASKEAGWAARAVEWDLALHDAISLASGNPYLQQEICRFRRLVRGFCRITGTVPILLEANAEHIGLLDALEARDGQSARVRMTAHIQRRLKDVLARFDEHPLAVPSKKLSRRQNPA